MLIILLLGAIVIGDGIRTLLFEPEHWHGTFLSAWTGWPEIAIGTFICLLGFWGTWRTKDRPSNDSAVVCLLLGIVLTVGGVLLLIFGDFPWRGTLVLRWTGWPQTALGLVICIVTIWDIRRRKRKQLKDSANAASAGEAKPESEARPLQAAENSEQAAPSKDGPRTL